VSDPQHKRKRDPITFSDGRFLGKALACWLLPSAAFLTLTQHAAHDTHAAASISQADRPPDDEPIEPDDGW